MFHPALSHLGAHTDRVSSAWLFLTVHFLKNLFAENLFFNLFQSRMKVPCFGEYLLRLLLGAGASGDAASLGSLSTSLWLEVCFGHCPGGAHLG